tara:strand:+ start:1486 stop:1602 length:117 start_codon:yes stop_codon:yes gene_type:complete
MSDEISNTTTFDERGPGSGLIIGAGPIGKTLFETLEKK